MRKLLIQMIIIVSLVTAFGAWTLNEWRKRYPEPEKQMKIYKGKWHKTYLEVIK